MSRTKNRGFQQSFSPSYTIRRWRLGKYIRLSKEDLKKGKTYYQKIVELYPGTERAANAQNYINIEE